MNAIIRKPRACQRPSNEPVDPWAFGYPRLTTAMAGYDEIVASPAPFRTTLTRLNSDEIALAAGEDEPPAS
jgi:hypothetical protein